MFCHCVALAETAKTLAPDQKTVKVTGTKQCVLNVSHKHLATCTVYANIGMYMYGTYIERLVSFSITPLLMVCIFNML